MKKLTLVVHVSLDGFVAGPHGELNKFPPGDENLVFVASLTESADTILFGRKSFELLDDYWPTVKDNPEATHAEVDYSSWYHFAKKVVVSSTLQLGERADLQVLDDNVLAGIRKLKEGDGKDILLFGSPFLTQLCMQHQLIDSYRIFINPVIMGEGIPLVAGLPAAVKLRLLSTKTFANGEIALYYEPLQPGE